MSNNKQSIKLYTEEDLIIAIGLARHGDQEWSVDEIVKDFTPIELPSDEEIVKDSKYKSLAGIGWIEGAKWMRDKIQGGIK